MAVAEISKLLLILGLVCSAIMMHDRVLREL
jgi:hypothetical protein